jgi:signal transduction histidine kinase
MTFLSSLRGKAILTSVFAVIVVLALAGGAFVYLNRGEERENALDRVSANSSAIQREFVFRMVNGASEQQLIEFADAAAEAYDVRVLLIERGDRVVRDTGGELDGKVIIPETDTVEQRDLASGVPYFTIQIADNSPGSDLILVATPVFSPSGQVITVQPVQYSLVLAVSESSLATAWLDLLPGLALAGAIALPFAVLLAVLMAGYITRPLGKLTTASLQMASGHFDVDVAVDRRDEVGQLAGAFNTMANRVGTTHTQMRTLVANVSHDMKTPLTSILGFSQMLRDGQFDDDKERQRMAAIIHEEAERLNLRLSDLLYLSELESGHVIVRSEQVNLAEIVRGVVERLQPDISAHEVTVQHDLPDFLTVTSDTQKVERTIENLLDNARKYTPDGGEIIIRGGNVGSRVWIEFTNTAPDIEPEEIPRLFERFYRRDRTRNIRAGSGLGLPIAQDIVALLGGSLTASLRDGRITFHLELPQASTGPSGLATP